MTFWLVIGRAVVLNGSHFRSGLIPLVHTNEHVVVVEGQGFFDDGEGGIKFLELGYLLVELEVQASIFYHCGLYASL